MYAAFQGSGKSSSLDLSLKKMLSEMDNDSDDMYEHPDDSENTTYSRYRGKGITKPKPTKSSVKLSRKRNKLAKKKSRT